MQEAILHKWGVKSSIPKSHPKINKNIHMERRKVGSFLPRVISRLCLALLPKFRPQIRVRDEMERTRNFNNTTMFTFACKGEYLLHLLNSDNYYAQMCISDAHNSCLTHWCSDQCVTKNVVNFTQKH